MLMSILNLRLKNIKNQWFLIFALTYVVSVFFGCGETTNDSQKTLVTVSQSGFQIPELLPRNPQLGSFVEQDKYLDIYYSLKEKLNKNPDDYRSMLQLAQLFMLEARITGEHGHYYPAALETLDEALKNNPPKDVEFGATSLKASVYLSLHKFKEAKELAEYAVTLNGYNALIYGSLVDANVELGNYDEAVKMADKMMSIRPDLRSYSRVSYLREIHGDLSGAIEAMEMAAKSGFPGYEETAWCRLTLGELYEQAGKWEQAEAEYKTILENRHDYPFAIAALARVDLEANNEEAAENRLKQAIKIIPEVSFYTDLATLYKKQGREDEVKKMIPEILDMLADDEANGHQMGMEYADLYLNLLDDPKKAMEFAQREYEKRPANIEVNQLMAEIFLNLGDYAKAKSHIGKAQVTDSKNPELMSLVALISAK